MRTITEFFGKSLKTIEDTIPALRETLVGEVTERLKAEGKSEEEVTASLDAEVQTALQAKVGETHKMEGDKLALFFNALQVASKAKGNLKRIVVMAPSKEGEKGPSGSIEVDGKFFVVELFPEARRAAPVEDSKKDGRPGKRGAKGRGGKGGRDGNREGGRGEGARERKAGERGPRKPAVPYTGPNRIVPVGSTAAASAAAPSSTSTATPAAPAAAPETPAAES
jgi:hypothetical protein